MNNVLAKDLIAGVLTPMIFSFEIVGTKEAIKSRYFSSLLRLINELIMFSLSTDPL